MGTDLPWDVEGLRGGAGKLSLLNIHGALWGHFRPIFQKESAVRKRLPGFSC